MDIMKFIKKVVLIGYIFCMGGGDECKAAQGPLDCYECSTLDGDSFCGDPFNDSHPEIRTVECDRTNGDLCAKWVRKRSEDDIDVEVIRTCSSNLRISLYITAVCMYESRPGSGHLCFCDSDNCNGASQLSQSVPIMMMVTMGTACLIKHTLFGHL